MNGLFQGANLALRFLLELGMLAALGYWGFQTGEGPLAKWGLGIGAPLVVALAWGAFVSPKAYYTVTGLPHLLLEVGLFGLAVIALFLGGQSTLAWAFGIVALGNGLLLRLWGE